MYSGYYTRQSPYCQSLRTGGQPNVVPAELRQPLHARAATTSERQVEATLRARLDAGAACDYASVQVEVRPLVPSVPVMHTPRPNLAQYDALLAGGLRG